MERGGQEIVGRIGAVKERDAETGSGDEMGGGGGGGKRFGGGS